MKTIFKILLIIFVLLSILILIVLIPLPQKAPKELDDSVLLMIGDYGSSVVGANYEQFFYRNGSVYLNFLGSEGKQIYGTLDNNQLKVINDFIEQEKFIKKKESYYHKFIRFINIFGNHNPEILFINKNGKTINVEPNKEILSIEFNKTI